jgi:hypothetical protein
MLRCFYYTTCSLRLWFWLISDDRPQPKTAGGLMMLEEVGVAGSFIDNSWILFQLMVLMLLRWRKWLVLLLGSCCDDAGGDREVRGDLLVALRLTVEPGMFRGMF